MILNPRRPKTVKRFASSRMNASGVVKIKRDGYSTVNGMSKDNAWWELSAKVRKRSGGWCEDHARRGQQVKGTDVHHIRALGDGGRSVLSNLLHLCDACHERRHPHNNHLKAHHAAKRLK